MRVLRGRLGIRKIIQYLPTAHPEMKGNFKQRALTVISPVVQSKSHYHNARISAQNRRQYLYRARSKIHKGRKRRRGGIVLQKKVAVMASDKINKKC
jgi:hypothetical protein